MLRLPDPLQNSLITNIDALRMPFPGSTAPSTADQSRRNSISSPANLPPSHGDTTVDTKVYNRVPLTKATLDLMDMPVPSGILAEGFAYHGLAPSFLKERHLATVLLDQIYSEIKR